MGYIVFSESGSEKAEEVVGDSAMAALTDKQKKTIFEWIKYLGKALAAAICKKLFTDVF